MVFKKLSEVLSIIKVVAAIVPLVRKLIEAVEIEGNGAEKKQAVLDAASGLIDALPWTISDEIKAGALKVLSIVIDIVVGVLNIVGHDWSA